jgi:hypothetical protein
MAALAARGALAALVTGTVFLLAGAAAAATPQQTTQRIFADLADNGRLDRPWTKAQIDRALHTPSLKEYDQPSRPAPIRRPAAVRSPGASAQADRALPFSGIDLALFAVVGAPLLLLGASLGRLARVKPEGELS